MLPASLTMVLGGPSALAVCPAAGEVDGMAGVDRHLYRGHSVSGYFLKRRGLAVVIVSVAMLLLCMISLIADRDNRSA